MLRPGRGAEDWEQMENPSLDLLMRRSFPELAAALRDRSAKILDRFRSLAKEALPHADELTLAELLDDLPKTLEDLAVTIVSTDGAMQKNFLVDSRRHGVCRFHQSYNLSELLVEYGILRSVIVNEVTGALGRALSLEESIGLHAGLDAATRRSVETFVNFQQDEIKAGSEAFSKYLSFLSHDLRGNLNAILLVVEVLRRELAGVPQVQESLSDLDSLRRAIFMTVGTMDRFLQAERFRRGKIEVKIAPVNVGQLVNDAANHFQRLAEEKNLALHVQASEVPEIPSDRELIVLVLQNLLSNAIKYTPKGGVRMVAEPLADGGCRVGVSDDGPGIADDKIREVFQPFVRGAAHGQAGTGLGLHIALQAVDLLGAKLWAENNPAGGATFYFELPPKPPNS